MARAYQEAHMMESLNAAVKSLDAKTTDLIKTKAQHDEKLKNLTTANADLVKKNAQLEIRVKANEHNAYARIQNAHIAQSANPNHTLLIPLHDVGTGLKIRNFPRHERDFKTMGQSEVIQCLQALDLKVLGMSASEKKEMCRAQIGLPKESSVTGGGK